MKYWFLSILIVIVSLGAIVLFAFLCFKSIIFLLSILSVLAITFLFLIVKHIKTWLVYKEERDKEIKIAERRAKGIQKYIEMKFTSGNMTDEDIEYLKEVLWKR